LEPGSAVGRIFIFEVGDGSRLAVRDTEFDQVPSPSAPPIEGFSALFVALKVNGVRLERVEIGCDMNEIGKHDE
jgi:hypothetical protein